MVEKAVLAKTATENFKRELERRIRAGYAGLFIRTFEEERTIKTIKACSDRIKRSMWIWDCLLDPETATADNPAKTSIKLYTGIPNPKKEDIKRYEIEDVSRLLPVFATVKTEPKSQPEKAVLCVMDFHFFIGDNVSLIRSIKNSLPQMKRDGKTVIFIGPRLALPEELEKDITTLDFPLPDRIELMQILDYVLKCAEEATPDKPVNITDVIKERLCEAALGLTSQETEDLFSLTLAKNYKLDEFSVKTVIEGKKDIIKKDGILEFFTPDISLEDVGGLRKLKKWFLKRIKSFTIDAHDFGLPYPKGVLMVGVPGCGKSLVAKAVAAFWGVPLVRLDMGRIYNKFQGVSEDNARRAIMLSEAVAPSVLWIDEVEKGFSGVKSSDETSGGVQARVVQTFLTWMQEKTSAVFLACTGNAVDKLPPELLRKGRFDEIFFVDLPNPEERKEIIKIQIRKRSYKSVNADGKITTIERKLSDADTKKIVEASHGFTGAEIEQAVIDALGDCYVDGKRALKGEDVVRILVDFVPLSKTMETEIIALRKWGETKAKNASEEATTVAETFNPFRIVKQTTEEEDE
jgi:SpoVK/Ycf46/Vps4 family AAA+-type ATPase